MNTRIMPQRVADHLGVRAVTLSETDPWGSKRTVAVEWRPLPVYGVALGHENSSEVPVVWVDTPPIHLRLGRAVPHVETAIDQVQLAFELETVVEGSRRDGEGQLEPGEYRIVSDVESCD